MLPTATCKGWSVNNSVAHPTTVFKPNLPHASRKCSPSRRKSARSALSWAWAMPAANAKKTTNRLLNMHTPYFKDEGPAPRVLLFHPLRLVLVFPFVLAFDDVAVFLFRGGRCSATAAMSRPRDFRLDATATGPGAAPFG